MSDPAGPALVLLDTCAAIWLMNRGRMLQAALAAIMQAGRGRGVFVSPVSAWEIGMLSKGRSGRGDGVQFLPDPKTWFAKLMSAPRIRAAPLRPEIAIEASFLPGELHADPADRLLIATARHLGAPIVTRDSRIIAYGYSGHVGVIAC